MNTVCLTGRLGQDPEFKTTSGGISLAKMRLAVRRPYKDASGENPTDWLDVVAWRHTAEYASQYLHKGDLIAVTGRVEVQEWETADGAPRRSYEIIAENIDSLTPRDGRQEQRSEDPGDEPGDEPQGEEADEEFSPEDLEAMEAAADDDGFEPPGDDDPFDGE
ncbi:MAG: single-stranded DNA-binding protein [Armatimonadia bacterium]|nr:single-stranded DNA-binding protein [Armatimonadia bacterium]